MTFYFCFDTSNSQREADSIGSIREHENHFAMTMIYIELVGTEIGCSQLKIIRNELELPSFFIIGVLMMYEVDFEIEMVWGYF